MTSKREYSGVNIFLKGAVKPINSKSFIVESVNSPNKAYVVMWDKKRWKCTCPDYIQNHKKCKHIYAVCYYLTVRDLEVGVKKFSEKLAECPICGQTDLVIKDGYSETKSGLVQRYHCKRCGKGFTARTGFEGRHGQALAVLLSLDLYYRGLSLRQISEHLASVYGITVSHGTVYGWIKHYVNIISKYLSYLKTGNSERCHADDTVVRVKSSQLRLWGMLDSETRMLIATHISAGKSAEDARSLLKNGLQKNAEKPLEIITDAAPEYAKAIEEELKDVEPILHVQASISTPLSNNKMERFFGTLKQRYKTVKCFNSQETAETFIQGFQTYYNFIRGHRGLGGMTPAQAAGITKSKLNWLDIIKETKLKATKHRIKIEKNAENVHNV